MDKLTAPITVKLTPEMAADAKHIGESLNLELSEYIRHLISLDLERAQKQFESLSQVFGKSGPGATYTAGDKV